MEASVGGVVLRVVEGDITQMTTDAIVNAANNHFWMGAGVAGAIKRAGGGNIETEAMSRGPVPVGESVVTRAGSLPARYVIHAAVMGQDLQTNTASIRDATWSTLKRAEELGIESVALPAFGTGVGGLPATESAGAMLGAALEFVQQEETALKEIVFVLFSDDLAESFGEALAGALR